MSLSDVNIIKGNGGLGRRNPSTDGVTGLITTGVAVAGKLVLGTTYKLQGISDAAAIGIDAKYDTTNSVLVFGVLDEIFRINPSATVFLIVAAQATLMADLLDPTKTIAPKLITDSEKTLVQLGVTINPIAGYTGTLTDGLDGQVWDAVNQAQLLTDYCDSIHAPLSAVIVEGYHFNGTTTAAKDLRTLESNKVTIVIGQDGSSAAATAKPNHAAVGSWLGSVSLAKVNENIGWPEKFPLTDKKKAKWLKASFSGGVSINSFTEQQLNDLDDKGYTFARTIAQQPGLYISDSHTCTEVADDYNRIEMNRTMDKAIKNVRGSLVPKLKSPIPVDGDTGFILTPIVVDLETQAQASLDPMLQDTEVSSADVYINPEQNVLGSGLLAVGVEVVPIGSAHGINVNIQFNNPFKTV